MAIQEKHKNVPIPEDLHKKLKTKASKEGKSIKDVLIKLVKDYLAHKEKKEE
jgi:predicted HicB family RNase H-like nuclease